MGLCVCFHICISTHTQIHCVVIDILFAQVCTETCLSSGLAAVISTFCIGLVSGAAGGLLLGRTAVVLHQSLELLADNKLLMEEFGKLIICPLEELDRKSLSQRTRNDCVFNIFISLFIRGCGVLPLALSLVVGVFIGSSTYGLVIKRYGETAMGKALTLAGPVCMMSVTASGYLLGLALGNVPSIGLILSSLHFYTASIFSPIFILASSTKKSIPATGSAILSPTINLVFIMMEYLFFFILKTKINLVLFLFPNIWLFILCHEDLFSIHKAITSLPMAMIITDVFNYVRQPIITLDASNSTNNAVVEGIFVGVLTLQLVMVVILMSLFVAWEKGGAFKICASAAALGAAVLTVVQSVLHTMGPVPTIGALMGVAGAAGVSLAAAETMTEKFGQLGNRQIGRLGVTVGAAVGAFLSSSTHSGLSGMYMSLCAATIPTSNYVTQLLLYILKHKKGWKFSLFFCAVIFIFFSVCFYFAGPIFRLVIPFLIVMIILFALCVS